MLNCLLLNYILTWLGCKDSRPMEQSFKEINKGIFEARENYEEKRYRGRRGNNEGGKKQRSK